MVSKNLLRLKCFIFLIASCFEVSKGLNAKEEPCWSENGGVCVDTDRSVCPSSNRLINKCPSQPNAVKCCLPYPEEDCTTVGGVCQRSDIKSCSGTYLTGFCPTQHTTVKCCKPSSVTSPNQPSTSTPKEKKVIAVDAGHGGRDGGAPGFYNITKESTFTLKTARKLKSELEKRNYEVRLTRNSDVFLSLKGRTDKANSWGVDLFVSIHYNAHAKKSAHGIEVFWFPGSSKGKSLATITAAELAKATGAVNRNLNADKANNLAVLRYTSMTAILVEGGFLSNRAEFEKLKQDSYLDKVAQGVANGVKKFLG